MLGQYRTRSRHATPGHASPKSVQRNWALFCLMKLRTPYRLSSRKLCRLHRGRARTSKERTSVPRWQFDTVIQRRIGGERCIIDLQGCVYVPLLP
ncbi:hypothetical protein CSUI_000666 [Cystoisospora suis]|uniref:Uncharacterized protein n=1 Tax=Cystoisospora suis TaxID=483139 RepID=A0A2C6KNA0_9APIC|nr:hypothetical protein CSUI_000666 [Cystoisospora suis]